MRRLLLILFCVLAGPSLAHAVVGPTFIQSKICSHTGALAAGSYSCTFPGSTTAGHAIVAVSASTLGTVTAHTFSDNKSGTYTTYQTQSGTADSPTYSGALGVGIAGTTGTTTVTVTFTNSVQPTYYALAIYEYGGVNTTTPVDVSAKNAQTSPTTATDAVTSGAIVTTANADQIVACAFTALGASTQTPGTGFTDTIAYASGIAIYGACEDYFQASSGSKELTFTASNATNDVTTFGVALANDGSDAQAACLGSSPSRTAKSASYTDVNSCVALAVSGDTITVPAGSATWTSTLVITGKKLTLVGAGKTLTHITDQGDAGAAIIATGSAVNILDISGFDFIASTAHISGMIQLYCVQFTACIRFHDNRVESNVTNGRGVFSYYGYGLIDHNDFVAGASIQGLSVAGGPTGGADGGYIPWQQPLTLGSANALYVEDNTFTKVSGGEDMIDAYAGARMVIRHNTFTNTKWGFHGTDSGGIRSPVSFEIYSNTFTNTQSSAQPYGGRIRGGTGVVFSNTYTASPGGWGAINPVYYRACDVIPGVTGWGEHGCNGTQYEIGSTSLSSDASRKACDIATSPTLGVGGCTFFPSINWAAHVRFCSLDPETLCTGDSSCAAAGKGTCTRYFDGDGTGGYPGRDQPGVAPGQVVTPIYFWSNTGVTISAYDLGSTNNCNGFGLDNYLLAGRDFIDNGSTAKPGYTAYTYPHPLQAATTPPAPVGVTNVQVIGSSTPTGVTLTWTADAATDLAGYQIYCAATAGGDGVLVGTRTLADVATKHKTVTEFTFVTSQPRTCYFTVKSYNTADLKSAASNEVPVTFTGMAARTAAPNRSPR